MPGQGLGTADRMAPGFLDRASLLTLSDGVLAIAALLAGSIHHRGPGVIRQPAAVAEVLWPFAVGWVIGWTAVVGIARWTGRPPLMERSRGRGLALLTGVAIWTVAVPVGAAIRASPLADGDAPAVFVAVVWGAGTLALTLWHGVLAGRRRLGRRVREPRPDAGDAREAEE